MAITFTDEVLRGIDQKVLEVETGIVIQKNALTKWDLDILEKVEATEGADLKAKMESFKMPNTQTAYEYYTPFLITVADYQNAWVDPNELVSELGYVKAGVNGLIASKASAKARVEALEAAKIDHESRISALENPTP